MLSVQCADRRAARRIPRLLWRIVLRKLKRLDAAARLEDLAVPAGNRVERLKGDQSRRRSIRINEPYRVTFRWENGLPTQAASKTLTGDPSWQGPATPPGEILLEEPQAARLGQLEAARRLGISLNRLDEMVLGRHGITAEMTEMQPRRGGRPNDFKSRWNWSQSGGPRGDRTHDTVIKSHVLYH